MKTAIVILNWNGKDLLQKFLPKVIAHTENDATIYVADNNSTDDSINFLQSHFPSVSIIQNKINGGYAKGYNDALLKVDEDLVVLMNSDIETTPGWLKPIMSQFINDPNLGAAQPKILDYNNKSYFEYAGAGGGFIDKMGYPYCRGRIFQEIEKDKGQYDDIAPIFWASGACLVVRKDIFWQAGALDELFFAHQEEIDLCWRIHNLGYSIKHIGTSAVYHVGGATLSTMNPQKTFYNFRNTLYALIKNVKGGEVWLIIFIRLILDAVAGIKFLTEGKPKHFGAILRAHFSFYCNLQKVLNKRQVTKQSKNYYSIYSIVWQHFVKKKNRYNELP